jgi:serine/threonine protein kinase
LAALAHPNVARAYDIDHDVNLHLLVMEYIDGCPLKYIADKHGPLSVARAADYVRQAALGLQHVHEADLVHRDVKPGNLLVDRAGVIKLISLGLVRFALGEEVPPAETRRDSLVGTPDYVAPEQAVDPDRADARADVYGLGATLYFCLTGRKPFPGGTPAQTLVWHQTGLPDPVRRLRPEVPEGLAALVERMLAKDPASRPQTAREVADALAPYAAGPIGPPEEEMPRLCPAVLARQHPTRGNAPGS